MMAAPPPHALVHLLQPWNDFYSHSKVTQTIVLFAHIGGLVLGGGLALATDRATFRLGRLAPNERALRLTDLAVAHRTVLAGLSISITSGLLLLASDIETFFGSWIFWTKMILVGLLLANGFLMTRAELWLARDATDTSPGWGRLRTAAIASGVLWYTVTLAGVALANLT